MLTLVKTEVPAMTQQRVCRLMNDILNLSALPTAEIRTLYAELETSRDALSRLLDKADGK